MNRDPTDQLRVVRERQVFDLLFIHLMTVVLHAEASEVNHAPSVKIKALHPP